MPVIVVANPKGGVGKSTLATNVAGALARSGHTVMLGDVDRLQDYMRLFGGGKVLVPGHIEGRNGRRFRVAAFPISIDTAAIEAQARDAVRRLPVR